GAPGGRAPGGRAPEGRGARPAAGALRRRVDRHGRGLRGPGAAARRAGDRGAPGGDAGRSAGMDLRPRTGRHGPDGARWLMDPVTLQVMVGALRAACEEMGVVLVRAAHSANIKERRDASTALFDAHGEMAMQAEHIPVHLGAMPAAVEAVRAEDPDEGDAWVLNDPYRGGTH